MTERLIIALFGVASVGVHWLVYLWVRYKVDEGTITHHFKEEAEGQALSVEQISERTKIKPARVAEVCAKSKSIVPYQNSQEFWCLAPA